MDILTQIASDKKREIALKKQIISINQLEQFPLFDRKTVSLTQNIQNSTSGIIAEHKRKSPSKKNINSSFLVEDVVTAYQIAGASGISVLTDSKYFGGSLEDLLLARAAVQLPLLRKEFIIDTYQIIEAKAHGADVILLIAALLSPNEIQTFSRLAQFLGLEVLLEVHTLPELQQSICESINLIGVNNRNLKTFDVSIENSIQIARHIPNDFVKVSESGIDNPQAFLELKKHGYQGFLIGEHFMKNENPEQALAQFIEQL